MASEGLHETRSNEINFKSLSLSIFLWSYPEKTSRGVSLFHHQREIRS